MCHPWNPMDTYRSTRLPKRTERAWGPGGTLQEEEELISWATSRVTAAEPGSLCPTAIPAPGFSLPARLCRLWALCDPGPPLLPAETEKRQRVRRLRPGRGGQDGDAPTRVNPPTTHLVTILTRAPMWSCRAGQPNGALGTVTTSGAKGAFFTLEEKRET